MHFDGASALIAVGEGDVALVVVSLEPPGVDVMRFVAAVKAYAGVPVLVGLQGYPDPDAVVQALDAGAQGLISLPVTPSELSDHLRRLGVGGPARVVVGGAVALQPQASTLKVGDRVLTLSAQDFQLVELLVRNAPNPVATDALVEVTGARRADPVVAVRVAVGRLRRRLAAGGIDAESVVQSVRGVGYRWVDPVASS